MGVNLWGKEKNMFTIIGERINMTRKSVKEKVWERDADFVAGEVQRQVSSGATHIDINAGGDPSKEVEDMRWLTEVVSKATELPLVFDSANPEALEEGVKNCNREGTIINSVTGEVKRIEGILPIVKKYNTGVVALTMDDNGMPDDYEGRMRITREIAGAITAGGIPMERMYFDHLILPASTSPGQARFVLRVIADTKSEFPGSHIALGLSNVSYGLPVRNNLNRAFLSMLIASGADGAIFDPSEPGMMSTLFSARAALGLDEYGMDYISAHRGGRLR